VSIQHLFETITLIAAQKAGIGGNPLSVDANLLLHMELMMNTRGDLQSVRSIGTLTSWQLLAEKAAADDGNSTEAEEDNNRVQDAGQADETHQGFMEKSFTSSSPYLSQLRSPSFFSPRKPGSAAAVPEDAKCLVTPKQHQMLYREYRVFNEIGSGAFGRVCVARRLADRKDVGVKEIKTSNLSGKEFCMQHLTLLTLAALPGAAMQQATCWPSDNSLVHHTSA
jgi:hypothetical protein